MHWQAGLLPQQPGAAAGGAESEEKEGPGGPGEPEGGKVQVGLGEPLRLGRHGTTAMIPVQSPAAASESSLDLGQEAAPARRRRCRRRRVRRRGRCGARVRASAPAPWPARRLRPLAGRARPGHTAGCAGRRRRDGRRGARLGRQRRRGPAPGLRRPRPATSPGPELDSRAPVAVGGSGGRGGRTAASSAWRRAAACGREGGGAGFGPAGGAESCWWRAGWL